MTSPAVMTVHGPVVGTLDEGINCFLGIPYADAARFAVARSPKPWDQPLQATRFGPGPAQFPMPWLPKNLDLSEDCLTLNVWTPRDAPEATLPVLVWIFGGGFEGGLSGTDMFAGHALARAGEVVVVTINYRVGALGFASLKSLGGPYGEASNLGLTDVVLALKWVRANIGSFGGDPGLVTVAGGSAGGFLAGALPATPSADGLYQRLALFSGGASRLIPADRADEIGASIAGHVAGGNLIDAPLSELFEAQRRVIATDIGARNGVRPQAFGVVLDDGDANGVLKMHPLDAYRTPAAQEIDVWAAANADEISLFRTFDPNFDPVTEDELIGHRNEWGVDHETATAIVSPYTQESASMGEVRERLLTDWIYRLPAARLVEAHTAGGGRGYLSLIGRADGKPAAHGCETSGIFGRQPENETGPERHRAAEITRAVIDFVRTGNPGWHSGVDEARTFGDSGINAGETYRSILSRWAGVARP
ncbi:carboxylesterase family protein [Arthrobacter sp. YN]|uniref:carboxylesterase family protein n=1 Tax=Arthrobacter sp. YN TaxID=2020486 RepID=UPI000B61F7BC|nr:carboxylesterase family protein [Arthrobacter sp. YN]ASN19974.1 carboxylesterase [Arthrobacter sp. YN]